MEFTQKKSPIFLVAAFVLLFAVGLGWGYFFSQVNANKAEINNAEQEIAQAKNTLAELKQSDAVLAQRGLNALKAIEATEVKWSNVLNTLNKITPIDPEFRRPMVEFLSYSGAEGGRLNFNVQTLTSENVKTLLGTVSKTIEVFNEAPDFNDAFVPSISKGTTQDNESVLTFILSAEYAPTLQGE